MGENQVLYRKALAGSATGAKAQNVEWFAADIVVAMSTLMVADLEIAMSLSTSVLVQISFDSGGTWASLVTPAATTYTKVLVPVVNGDLVQLRTDNAAGTTVNRCIVGFRGD